MVAYLGEFLGTLLLVLLGNGVVANVNLSETKGHHSGWIVITFGWGMAVFVGVWCVGPMSGAHLNPAVTLGLAAAGEFDWANVAGYLGAQMAGAIAGAVLVYLVYLDHYAVTDDANAKLATFSTGPAIRRNFSNFLSEAVGTMVLVLAVLLAVEPSLLAEGPTIAGIDSPSAKIGLGTLGALPVGLLVLSIGLSLGGTTGYAINPARDLGPRLVHAFLPIPGKRDSDWDYAWIPVAGPIAGAVLAAVIYLQIS
ncbi:MIP/aquaporin family protein [Bythopirellula polymerisocia]|uniref:Glycerol uptake facilitator protein n=1 Tax=Bythopirellula polymerisocia TaxID=2528003 RepID=A0A5C6CNQ2_9BACT|nr:MIP/aquaporin family protein [Bythopirellula polymerisocia]TWU26072.1 Glycerol uptake facilitator protein [Bythopirellula polymerisocia]